MMTWRTCGRRSSAALFPAVLAVLVAVGTFGSSSAILPGGCVRPGRTAEAVPGRKYGAEGLVASAVLQQLAVVDPIDQFDQTARDAASPVTLGYTGAYPPPCSQPVVLVTVQKTADFTLRVSRNDGRLLDEFGFVDVEPGTYRFLMTRSAWPNQPAVVTLVHDLARVGRQRIDTAALSGLK